MLKYVNIKREYIHSVNPKENQRKILALKRIVKPLREVVKEFNTEYTRNANTYLMEELRKTRLTDKDKTIIRTIFNTTRKNLIDQGTGKSYRFKAEINHYEGTSRSEINSNLKNGLKQLKTGIKQFRSRQITPNVTRKRFEESNGDRAHTYNVCGGVMSKPGTVYELYIVKKSKEIFDNKIPKDKAANYVGLELEFFCNKEKTELAKLLCDAKLQQYVCLKTDSSIQPISKYYGHEICILARENEVKDIVKKVLDVLATTDAQVNKSCGMHVHLDMRSRNKEVVFSNLVSAQPILYAMNPKSRETGRYSKRTVSKKFNDSSDRYRGINPTAFDKHQTVEVRIHSGTVSENKIMNWLNLLLKITNKVEEVKRAPRFFRGFVKQYDIDENLAGYIVERIQKFHANGDLEEVA